MDKELTFFGVSAIITCILIACIVWLIYLSNKVQGLENKTVTMDIIYREFIPEQYREFVDSIHDELDFDYKLIYRLVHNESRWNHWATGKNADGSIDSGLCQLNSGNTWGINLFDPEQNLRAGFKYLRQMVDRFGSLENGLMAYNAGPGRFQRGTIPESTRNYVRRIMK